jgi:hypothetical protein
MKHSAPHLMRLVPLLNPQLAHYRIGVTAIDPHEQLDVTALALQRFTSCKSPKLVQHVLQTW